MDKERYSRSHRDDRDRDRDSSPEHSPQREGGRRRDRDGDSKRRDSDHYRSSRREDREDERDRGKERGRRSVERGEREGSRDRERHHHERSHEGTKEKESRSKRKDRDEENLARDGKKKSRFSDGNGERKSRFEDVAMESENKSAHVTEGSGVMNPTSGVSIGASSITSVASEASLAPSQTLLLTKVSSIYTTDENKASIVRSHEVPGKSSTDGRPLSTAGKSTPNMSSDALAKAKKALQFKHKGLADKLKKLPLLNKGTKSTSEASPDTRVPSSTTTPAVSTGTSFASAVPHSGLAGLGSINIEAVKRAQELAANMGFRLDRNYGPVLNLFSGQAPSDTAVAERPAKPPVLRVDALGREIDEHGNVISVTKPSNLSTLKVNINKQKKDAFQILKPQLEEDLKEDPHFDPRMGIDVKKIVRPKRMTFQFVEEGKWTRDAESLKLKSQFGEAKERELKVKQAHLAKAKDDINPNLIEVSERVPRKEKPKEPIPDVEWWDASVLVNGEYSDIADGIITEDHFKIEKLTHYIEHPRPIEPPAEAAPPPPQPLKLTKKEQKKLRTQRRLAKEKDKQEMIRQGLLEPPKAKVKMSNLMKVLGSEATQDPTKLEKEIRTAAAEREQAHTDRNAARKLTPAEKREKKERKLFDDPTTVETLVSVYKIKKLSHPRTRFKVEMNARNNRLTGCSVMTEGMSVVVVEGKSKAINRYGKLMLRRINWEEAEKKEEKDDEEEEANGENKCWLVWQGSVAKPSFHRFHVQECLTESSAKKIFIDAGVVHYWDLAVNYSDD
ncbi:PREDICTED: U4/U6 small nuclear ribonucleoprotein Prp3 isoform X1 [Camelina sativa]|uniref:U4/U6 small nuclear ribonucleoprotein Prp3 isoform X1 n=2 Tax=Camelina sativa TaxID=90675 RepID=A0ABM1QYC4_CAMSA|nr:PREDICTED: U4/U6 small nuclear ribonucleoprotein Prp3 isoform X1 [Camelina sativa]